MKLEALRIIWASLWSSEHWKLSSFRVLMDVFFFKWREFNSFCNHCNLVNESAFIVGAVPFLFPTSLKQKLDKQQQERRALKYIYKIWSFRSKMDSLYKRWFFFSYIGSVFWWLYHFIHLCLSNDVGVLEMLWILILQSEES